MDRRVAACLLVLVAMGAAFGCGAKSGLDVPSRRGEGGGAGMGGADAGLEAGGAAGSEAGGAGGQLACQPGEVIPCGSDVGECVRGRRFCDNGSFGPCQGAIEPVDEACNDLDDDCDGVVDNGFALGSACDGDDSDLCRDDVMTCEGCSLGPDELETCNGVDDNCNGIVDADCDFGNCQPSLLVTGSTPSDPGCLDFPVTAGSTGRIEYPCTGGPVSAVLGGIRFSGSVDNGQVSLTAVEQITGPDNCLWQLDHAIRGAIASGTLRYSYSETLLTPGPGCWSPCTETGTVEVDW